MHQRIGASQLQGSLARSSFFNGLQPQTRLALQRAGRSITRGAGMPLYIEGDDFSGLYCLVSGCVRFTRASSDSTESLMHIAHDGFWFGEAAAITGEPHQITATPNTDCDLFYLYPDRVQSLRSEFPDFDSSLVKLAIRRYRLFLGYLAAIDGLCTASRVASRLAMLTSPEMWSPQRFGLSIRPGELAVSQSDLAKLVGISRQRLNPILRSMAKARIIELSFRSVRVLDRDKLAAFATHPKGERPSNLGRSVLHNRAS